MIADNNYRTLSSTSTRGLRHNLPPMRLWQKAKRLGIWNPVDIDLTQDIKDWQGLSEDEQNYLRRLCASFMAGEESVTLDLLPLIRTVAEEGRIEEEMYLTSFLWEEAKHLEGFRRFFDEVAQDTSDLSRFYGHGFKKIFYEELPASMNRLYTDTSVEAQVRASVTYNMIIEGVMAENGYRTFGLVLNANNLMPGMQQFVAYLKRDESRHIAFAIYFLSRHIAESGDRAWNAIEERMHELMAMVRDSGKPDYSIYKAGKPPFNLDLAESQAYSTMQFNKRLERLRKARTQTLDEINNIANNLDEAMA